eukprot:752200-Hanusia_phi.AAC.6
MWPVDAKDEFPEVEKLQMSDSFGRHVHMQVQECEVEIADLKMLVRDLVDINKALKEQITRQAGEV